mmetsp:Transcript_135058/g.238955  ORF Transcript_135058/g.238955 Transcript_135058/m.238955 type:complete len:274 (-) Transcript_135058:732-1553(-)
MLVLANFCDGINVIIGCIDFGNGFVLCLGVFRNLCLELRNHGIVDLDLPSEVRHGKIDLLIFFQTFGLLRKIIGTLCLKGFHHGINGFYHLIKVANLCCPDSNCQCCKPEAVAMACLCLQSIVSLDRRSGCIPCTVQLEEGRCNTRICTNFLARFDCVFEGIPSLICSQDLDGLLDAGHLLGPQLLAQAPLLKFGRACLLCLIEEFDVCLFLAKCVIIGLGRLCKVRIGLCQFRLLQCLVFLQVFLGGGLCGHQRLVDFVPRCLCISAALQVG